MSIFSSARLDAVSLVLACCAGAVVAPGVAFAQSSQAQSAPIAPGDTRRLTDQERAAILDGNTIESAEATRGQLPGSDFVDRRIHGEVGFMIGTGGSRAIYGTADIPLGDRAGATLSFESSRFAYRR